MLEIRNLQKTYGKVQALRGVDLRIDKGECLALVGESGCGKSTLARHLLGLEKPDQGEVLLEGTHLEKRSPRDIASKVQMIFQDPASSLNPRRRVIDLISEPLEIQGGVSKENIRKKALALMERVGLSPDHAKRFPHMFSGGQKQRIGIARALMTDPQLVVCDEPVSALDVSVQAQVLNLLKELQEERKLSYLFISHDLGVVRFVAQRVAVMYLGRIVEEAPVKETFTTPRHPYTRLLLDSYPRPDEAPLDISLTAQELPSPANPPPGCAFNPRCPHVTQACKEVLPPLKAQGPGRNACIRSEILDLTPPDHRL